VLGFVCLLLAACASTSPQDAAPAAPSAQTTPGTFAETNCQTPNLQKSALQRGYQKCMSAFAGNPAVCSQYLECWNQAK
jgi:hypothetical protein